MRTIKRSCDTNSGRSSEIRKATVASFNVLKKQMHFTRRLPQTGAFLVTSELLKQNCTGLMDPRLNFYFNCYTKLD